jgi:hypothetical protein
MGEKRQKKAKLSASKSIEFDPHSKNDLGV